MATIAPIDHTAVNWDGEPATLDPRELLDRMNALARYAAARLRPFSEWDASPIDAFEADCALDMWAACRSVIGFDGPATTTKSQGV